MQTQCSNCLTTLTLNRLAGTVTVKVAASGRGSKRVEARTLTSPLVEVDAGYWEWEAPCCPGYGDSYDVYGGPR